MPNTEPRPVITCDAARRLVDAAIAHAVSLGEGIAVAVVDTGGHVVAAARMDGISAAVNGFAEDKAYTAAMTGVTTTAFSEDMESSRQQEFGALTRPRLCAWPGGTPLYEGAALVGGVGVSGAPGPVDIACSEAAVAALGLSASAR